MKDLDEPQLSVSADLSLHVDTLHCSWFSKCYQRHVWGRAYTAHSTYQIHLIWSCCSGRHRHWGRGGKPLSQDNWGNLCWLVHPGISHQVCRVSPQGEQVVVIRLPAKLSLTIDWLSLLLPQYNWCPGNSPILHLPAPQQVVLSVLTGVHRQGSSDI